MQGGQKLPKKVGQKSRNSSSSRRPNILTFRLGAYRAQRPSVSRPKSTSNPTASRSHYVRGGLDAETAKQGRDATSAHVLIILGSPPKQFPGLLPGLSERTRSGVNYYIAVWATFTMYAPKGTNVGSLFQMIAQDSMLIEATILNAQAFKLAIESDTKSAARLIQQHKSSLIPQLRQRLTSPTLASNEVILTIICLLNLELLDCGAEHLQVALERHLKPIRHLMSVRTGQDDSELSEYVKFRVAGCEEYIKFLQQSASLPPSMLHSACTTPMPLRHPFPPEAWRILPRMPPGLAAIALTTLLDIKVINLIDSVGNLTQRERFPSFVNDPILWAFSRASEATFRCRKLLQSNDLNAVEELLVLGLNAFSFHCSQTALLTQQSCGSNATYPPAAVVVENSLPPARCISLQGLRPRIVHDFEPLLSLPGTGEVVRRMLIWVAMLLRLTSDPPNTPWELAHEVSRASGRHEEKYWIENLQKCREEYFWDEELTRRGVNWILQPTREEVWPS